jgi:hypothetical protein
VSGHTFVITSFLTVAHPSLSPRVWDVNTKDAIKKPDVITPDNTIGQFEASFEKNDDVFDSDDVVEELIYLFSNLVVLFYFIYFYWKMVLM